MAGKFRTRGPAVLILVKYFKCAFFFFIAQVGKVETMIIHDASWQKLETLALTPSGNAATRLEATILSLIGRRQTNGRSLDESDFEASSDELVNKVDDVRVRVRLCLMTDQDICGDYTEAEGEIRFFFYI